MTVATEMTVPSAMVLSFSPELTHSVWIDFAGRCRTRAGLIRQLRAGVKRGQWVGYRLMTIEFESIGNTAPPKEPTECQ